MDKLDLDPILAWMNSARPTPFNMANFTLTARTHIAALIAEVRALRAQAGTREAPAPGLSNGEELMLWDAINAYARTCGGKTGTGHGAPNPDKGKAVDRVRTILGEILEKRSAGEAPALEGVPAALDANLGLFILPFGSRAMCLEKGRRFYGWWFERGPENGQWVSARKATENEIKGVEAIRDAAAQGSPARSAPPSEAGSTWKNWIAPCGCTVDLSRWYCPKHQAADAERHPDGAPAPAEDLEAVRNLRLCARHTVESWRAWETSKSGNEAMRAMERHRHEIGVLQNTMNFNEEALNLLLARPSPPGGPAKKEGEA
jgi:hypothetical protein